MICELFPHGLTQTDSARFQERTTRATEVHAHQGLGKSYNRRKPLSLSQLRISTQEILWKRVRRASYTGSLAFGSVKTEPRVSTRRREVLPPGVWHFPNVSASFRPRRRRSLAFPSATEAPLIHPKTRSVSRFQHPDGRKISDADRAPYRRVSAPVRLPTGWLYENLLSVARSLIPWWTCRQTACQGILRERLFVVNGLLLPGSESCRVTERLRWLQELIQEPLP